MQANPTPNLDDPRMGYILKEGFEGNISVLGFPYDIGAKRAGKPIGQEYGPDCLRRFLPKAGPIYNAEYDIDISKLDLTDYGNIECGEDLALESLLAKLGTKVSRAVEKNTIPFTIGGSKDISYGCLSGIRNSAIGENVKLGLISLQKFCDKESLFEGNKVDQDCGVKMYLSEEKSDGENKLQLLYFGTEKYDNDIDTNKFKNSYKDRLNFVHLDDIRKAENPDLNRPLGEPITQAGALYTQKIQDFLQKCDICHLSISLEVMNSLYCPGVPKAQKNGLTGEEIIEIMFQSGRSKKIISVSVSDYNPRIEDWRTGRLISNMFYYFSLGYCSR